MIELENEHGSRLSLGTPPSILLPCDGRVHRLMEGDREIGRYLGLGQRITIHYIGQEIQATQQFDPSITHTAID